MQQNAAKGAFKVVSRNTSRMCTHYAILNGKVHSEPQKSNYTHLGKYSSLSFQTAAALLRCKLHRQRNYSGYSILYEFRAVRAVFDQALVTGNRVGVLSSHFLFTYYHTDSTCLRTIEQSCGLNVPK